MTVLNFVFYSFLFKAYSQGKAQYYIVSVTNPRWLIRTSKSLWNHNIINKQLENNTFAEI